MHANAVTLFALLASLVVGQARHTSRLAIEAHRDSCQGLDNAQCCAQLLELAGFRATGDQVPDAAKTPVRLSCGVPERVIPAGACRSIVSARGFATREVSGLCEPASLERKCRGDKSCNQCMSDLNKLDFKAGYRACYAVTYVAKPLGDEPRVITVRDGRAGEGEAFELRKRRTVVQ